MKKSLIVTLILSFVLCFSIGIMSVSAAEAVTITNDDCKVIGASIRYHKDDNGSINGSDLRFEFNLKKDVYDSLTNPILNVEVSNGKSTITKQFDNNYIFDKNDKDGKAVKAGRVYLYNIPVEQYSRNITLKVNVKDDNGIDFTTEPLTRSISYVATAALNDTSNEKSSEQYEQLYKSLDKTTIRSFDVPSDINTITLENDDNKEVALTLKHSVEFHGEKGVLEVGQKVSSSGVWTPFKMSTINRYDNYSGKYVVVRAYFEKTEGSAYVKYIQLNDNKKYFDPIYPGNYEIKYNEWADYVFECNDSFQGLSFKNIQGTDSKFYIANISMLDKFTVTPVLDFETINGVTNGLTHGTIGSEYGTSDWGTAEINTDLKYVGSGAQSLKLTIDSNGYKGQTFYDNARVYGGVRGSDTFTFYAYVDEDVDVTIYLMTGSGLLNTVKSSYSKVIKLKKGGHTYSYNFIKDYDSGTPIEPDNGLSGFSITNMGTKTAIVYVDDFCFNKSENL